MSSYDDRPKLAAGEIEYSGDWGVFWMGSFSDRAITYRIDLLAYPFKDGDFNGECDCPRFLIKCAPNLKGEFWPGTRFRCRHVDRVRDQFAGFALRRLAENAGQVVKEVQAREIAESYSERVHDWLLRPGNIVCIVCLLRGGSQNRATQCHHWKGRIHQLLLDQRWWLPVCADCHEWIHRNIDRARALNLICPKGLFNTVEDRGALGLRYSARGITVLTDDT